MRNPHEKLWKAILGVLREMFGEKGGCMARSGGVW